MNNRPGMSLKNYKSAAKLALNAIKPKHTEYDLNILAVMFQIFYLKGTVDEMRKDRDK